MSIGDADVALRLSLNLAVFQSFEGQYDLFSAECRQSVMKCTCGVIFCDRRGRGQEDGASIKAGFHLHALDAGNFIACHDCALHGSGTPPAGQERAVNVDAAMPWRFQNRLGQDQPVSDNHSNIEVKRGEGIFLL